MNIFSYKFINIVTIIVTIIVFLCVNFFIDNIQKEDYAEKIISSEKDIPEESKEELEKVKNNEINYDWSIKIEKIGLYAPVKETTSMDVLNNYVGHFEDTTLESGNIGLAAHNRGYENNYFASLKDVKIGDEVLYTYNEFKKVYVVDLIEIIRNTDWSYLEETEKNKITMITCTENEPEYRLCVQATEKNI